MADRVIDVSEFTGTIPYSWWERLRDEHNVKGAVIQAWGGGPEAGRQNNYWSQQSEGARLAFGDGGIASYVWPPRDVGEALVYMEAQSSSLMKLQRFIALDVEAGAGVTLEQVGLTRELGQVPYIYASPNSWRTIMGNTTRFSHVPLWMAGYPQRFGYVHWTTIEKGEARYLPFGGWTSVHGWQFDGTTPYRNETLDLNVFRDGIFGGENVEDLLRIKQLMAVAGLFAEAHAAALMGKKMDADVKGLIKWLLNQPN